MGSRFVVVVPTKCLYFFKDIDGWEVVEELADEGAVDIVIVGVARQAVFEVAEDLLALADAVS
jgi:thymidine kinase